MKLKKLIIIILMMFTFSASTTNWTVLASETVSDQAENAFLNSNAYQKIKNKLISSKPLSTKQITDKSGKIKNEVLVYRVNTNQNNIFNNKNATGTVSTTVESPLVINYDVINQKIVSAIIFDYSSATSDNNKIKIINLLSEENILVSPNKLSANMASYANNIKKDQDQVLRDTTENVVLSKKSNSNLGYKYNTNSRVTCSIFTCTKYKSGGGNWDEKCTTFSGVGCSAVGLVNKWASFICTATSAVGCYVPKYKVCVRGHWRNYNVCPARV